LTLFSGNWYTSRTIRKLMTLALAAAVLAAACTGYHPAPTARRGGELVVALGQDAQSLNPLVAGDVWSVRAYTPLFPQLYEAGADLTVRPSLAAALPRISGDGLTWTVALRTARWSDGRPITADDVVYTVQSETDPSLDTRAVFDWSPLKSVERVDDSTVRFHLSRADSAFLGDRLLAPIVPKHALQGVALASMSTAIFSTQPSIAGGPFRLRLRNPGISLGMSSNGHYFGPKPYLDTLTMLVLSDQTQLETEIAQGNVGWAPDIPASVAAQLRGVTGVTVRSFPQLGRYSLVFNTRAGRPFAKLDARTGVAAALDRAKIAAAASGVPVSSGINSASWAYAATSATPAGGASLAGGELLIPQGDAARAAAAAEVARETKLNVKAVPPADFQSRLRSGDFDAALAGLGEGVDPDPALDVASWETPASDPHGHNFAGLADPQLDALLKQDLAADPADHAARKPLLQQVEARITQELPFVDLWTVEEHDAFGAALVGTGAVGPQLDQALQSSFYARWSLAG
jgi:peptide/nickel transport system substrate-binding protein